MQQCKEMAVFLFQRMEGAAMNRKYKNSFNKDNIDRMFSEPNDTGSIRMLSIHPQMGIKMILVYARSFIVIRNGYGVIVRFTRFQDYAGFKNYKPITSNAEKKLYYVCGMLNYVLVDHGKRFGIRHVVTAGAVCP